MEWREGRASPTARRRGKSSSMSDLKAQFRVVGRVTVQFAVLPKHQCTQYLGSIGGLKSGNFTSEKIERRVIFVKKKYEFLSDSSCISFRKISAEQEK